MHRVLINSTVACILTLALTVGCQDQAADSRVTQVQQLQDKVEAQARLLVEKDAQLLATETEIQKLRQLEGDRALDRLVHVAKIELERLSGGYDDDKDGVDEGVVVYLVLKDQDGDTLKAAGNLDVRLVDLAMPEGRQVVGKLALDSQALRSHWFGRFLTSHYTVRIPWSGGLKRAPHKSITVLVRFTDLLSGRVFSTQKDVEVDGAVGPVVSGL